MGVGGQRHAPTALPSGKRPGAYCTGGWVRKISPPPSFDRQTVQPVLRRYTDWTIPANSQSYSSCQYAHSSHMSSEYPSHLNCFRRTATVVTIKVKKGYFALFTPWKCIRASRGIAPLILNLVSSWRLFVNFIFRPPWPWERIPGYALKRMLVWP